MTEHCDAPGGQTPTTMIQRKRWSKEAWENEGESVIVEEPMEIQLQGKSIAVLMRTPGNDQDLVRGFLITEGIIKTIDEILRIQHCSTVPFPEAEDNILTVSVNTEAPLWKGHERNFYASSSCGICGKGSIEAVLKSMPNRTTRAPQFRPEQILDFPEQLRDEQAYFRATGGCHGAALFDSKGKIIISREDVGRHNAVDKVIGASLKAGVTLENTGLFVSGRISFEIVQKAAISGIGWIGGVSAPSSLAANTASALGMTLIGFCRPGRFTQYTR